MKTPVKTILPVLAAVVMCCAVTGAAIASCDESARKQHCPEQKSCCSDQTSSQCRFEAKVSVDVPVQSISTLHYGDPAAMATSIIPPDAVPLVSAYHPVILSIPPPQFFLLHHTLLC